LAVDEERVNLCGRSPQHAPFSGVRLHRHRLSI
jgi:hypothetical protein